MALALSFTNTSDEPLVGDPLTRFLQELTWKSSDGSLTVSFGSDGYVKMGSKVSYEYEIRDTGNYCEYTKLMKTDMKTDDGVCTEIKINVWIGIFIVFRVGEHNTELYYPVVHNGKYYLYGLNGLGRGRAVAEGFIPAPPPTGPLCSICFEQPANYAAVPCGHKCGCGECFRNIMERGGRCPICRADIERVIRVYETEAPNYAAAVAKTTTKEQENTSFNVNDMTEFPPMPRPVFEVDNPDSTYRVIEGGRRNVYNWSEFLNKFNKNSKNIVVWRLLNGDEQHGKVCDIYNKVYVCVMDKYPMYFGMKFVKEEVGKQEGVGKVHQPLPKPLQTLPKTQNLKNNQALLSANALSWTPRIK